MTGSMDLILALIGVELVALVLVLLGLSWFRGRAARRRDAKAMQVLVARVRKGRADRETVLRRFLEQRLGLSGDALAAATVGLLRAELAILHRFAGLYRTRDAGSAAQFDIDLHAAIEPYHELSADLGAEPLPAPEPPEVEVDESGIRALREENQRLSDELQITMETMSRMLNEYSTMFSGGEPADSTAIGARSAAADAGVDGKGSTPPPMAESEAGPSADDDIMVVADDPDPAGEPASRTESDRDAPLAPGDEGTAIEPAGADADDLTVSVPDADPIEDRPSVAPKPYSDAASRVDDLGPPATAGPAMVTGLDEPGTDGEGFSVGSASGEAPSDIEGADLEAVSETPVTGDSESLTPDRRAGAEPPDGGLFDEDDDALFDAAEPSAGESVPEKAVDDVIDGLDEIDDLFDAEDPFPVTPEQAGEGVR